MFCSEGLRSAAQNKGAATILDDDDNNNNNGQTPAQEVLPAAPGSVTAVSPVDLIRTRRYWKRLELAENYVAVAESLKLWLGIVPWRVDVLYDGKKLVSSLAAEEEALPWPPVPESSTGNEDVQVEREGCPGSDGGRIPGQGA